MERLVVDNNGLDPNGHSVGPSDQRSQIKTFNIAPSWIRLIEQQHRLHPRRFRAPRSYNYYPSDNPFADLQSGSAIPDGRSGPDLTNGGVRSTLSYVEGIHNVKAGAVYQQTFLEKTTRSASSIRPFYHRSGQRLPAMTLSIRCPGTP